MHIPFCKKACSYCDFYFVTNDKFQEKFTKSVCRELQIQKDFFATKNIQTVYFGGGTPSRLKTNYLEQILNEVRATFTLDEDAEITLEANPDDITSSFLNDISAMGFNRISLGLQSLHEEDLLWMHRAHSAEESRKSLELIFSSPIQQVSVDFIYGLPHQSFEKLEANFSVLNEFPINHVSCYALTIEEGTPLQYAVDKKRIKPLENSQVAAQYVWICSYLKGLGFEHYEVSNFAKNGSRAKHNSNYWKGHAYLGLGPAAHSKIGDLRIANNRNLANYINGIKEGSIPQRIENLNDMQKFNEYLLTSLRTLEGVSLEKVKHEFPSEIANHFSKELQQLKKSDEFYFDEKQFRLTEKGWLRADAITSNFFIVD